MHEGLLIFSRQATAKNDILFCNKPAQKLLTLASTSHEAQRNQEQEDQDDF